MDRPNLLDRCLGSIARGSRLPAEVVVSDDTRNVVVAGQVRAVCEKYSFVRYVAGPKRGLCANRNHVIRQATGGHVSLLDDDAVVGDDFVELVENLIGKYPNTILTGDVLEDGVRRQAPSNPTFLGHFGRPVAGEQLENINLNCNVLPRAAFANVAFDESIAYGYEDTDLCAQLLARGYRIVHAAELVNQHLPPAATREQLAYRHRQSERARVRVVWRRWAVHRRRPLAGAVVASIAWMHFVAHRCLTFVRRGTMGMREASADSTGGGEVLQLPAGHQS
jgi:GT2 family glycosyltransferase